MSEERFAANPPGPAPRPRVLIVTAVPTTSWALEQLLAGELFGADLHLITDTRILPERRDFQPSALVVAPQNWEEMSRWLPDLHRFRRSPWLVLAEFRIAGMFAFSWAADLSTIVGSGASLAELREAFVALLDRVARVPPGALLSRFALGLACYQPGQPPMPLTPRELQCGCAASLGLSNRQIAQALFLSEETVKKHVHQLLHKLQCNDRVALGALFERASTLLPPAS